MAQLFPNAWVMPRLCDEKHSHLGFVLRSFDRQCLWGSSNAKLSVSHQTSKIFWLMVYLPLWKWWNSSVGMIIPNIWKVIKFHGSSHHQPDRFRFNPLTSSLLVRFIMLYYISQSLHITNHQPVKDIWIAPSISRSGNSRNRSIRISGKLLPCFIWLLTIINHMINDMINHLINHYYHSYGLFPACFSTNPMISSRTSCMWLHFQVL